MPDRNADYLIIGGGIAGTTAAETIRSRDKDGSIVIVSAEPYPLYSRIMLSKRGFFLGQIPEDRIWLKTKEWYKQNDILLLAERSAVSLETKEQTITLDDGEIIEYKKLLLAVGSRPNKLNIPGTEKNGIYSMYTLNDARKIIGSANTAKKAVVAGGGFIAFEMCDLLRKKGLEVTLIMRKDKLWSKTLDDNGWHIIEQAILAGGVKLIKNDGAAEILGDSAVAAIKTKNGNETQCDLFIAGIGINCPTEPFMSAGISCDKGIITNEYLETNVSNIWAAGDAAEFFDTMTAEKTQTINWANAQGQGRIAGINMTGGRELFQMTTSFTSGGFGITIATVGNIYPTPPFETDCQKPTENNFTQTISKNGKISGAILINNNKEISAITQKISNNIV